MSNKLKPLIIGDLEIKIPIIQGGMGVRVSTASLASAVANYGGAGTIASVGLALGTPEHETNYPEASKQALRAEIGKVKTLTSGVVGVNIMVALTNYEDLVRTAVEEKADFIVSGAGLPLRLPELAIGSSIKLIPIVSSAKAASIIIKTWNRRYKRFPDAFVVEGPLAGGHLGFKSEDLKPPEKNRLEDLVVDVVKIVKEYEEKFKVTMPVIAAGGIFDGGDVARFFKLGAGGVQMATRFVATDECSVSDKFKKMYLEAREKDIVIIESPVGMPGRAIMTELVDKVLHGKRVAIKCNYQCLKTCNPETAPYCIGKALCNASNGDLDNAIVFAGKNVSRVEKIVSVKELMDGIVNQAIEELYIKKTGETFRDIEMGDIMGDKKHFSLDEAKKIGEQLGLKWDKFDLEQFCMGMDVELEHGLRDSFTNVTEDNSLVTGKIALAHLNEFPDYYTRLEKMEKEAENFWEKEQ